MTARVPICFVLLLVAGLAGCSGGSPEKTAPQPAIRLSASLVSPTDIVLTWQVNDRDATSRIVEFATEPNGTYTVLQFVPPSQTTYKHPDLMPKTPFYYRIRPVHGPASRTVDVTLPPGDIDAKAEKDDHAWAVPQTLPGPKPAIHPIRGADPEAGAPTDLKATIMHANGIRFTWTDHASDEQGYLIEVKPAGSADFSVASVLDPNVNSIGVITLPEEKRATYRVRAYYYGEPSNLVHLKTGADKAEAEPSAPAVGGR